MSFSGTWPNVEQLRKKYACKQKLIVVIVVTVFLWWQQWIYQMYLSRRMLNAVIFSSAGWANSITGQKLSVCLCVNQDGINHNCYTYKLVILHELLDILPRDFPPAASSTSQPMDCLLAESLPRSVLDHTRWCGSSFYNCVQQLFMTKMMQKLV